MPKKIILLSLLLCSGCAILHHVQIGEIDNRKIYQLTPVEIKASEMGIDLNDARGISKAVLNEKSGQQANDILTLVQLFQMGPTTGAPVYNLAYMYKIQKDLQSQCTDGFLTGIQGIRETRKYPVISGEIIKVKAYCARKRN